jgi:predicted RNA methylase
MRTPATFHSATMPGLARAFRRWVSTIECASESNVAGADPSERAALGALGGVATAIAGVGVAGWSGPLRAWATRGAQPPPELVDAVRVALGRGIDALAVLYNASISAANRRRLGTVFTPPSLVEHMLSLAEAELGCAPKIVVDPGAGVGAFSIAAAVRWPRARVVAVDVNIVTLGLLAARIAFEADATPASSSLRRVELVLGDYLDQLEDFYAAGRPGPVLALGNPPYTRVQELPLKDREKAAVLAGDVIDSGHANLAMLFQAATFGTCAPPTSPAWCCRARSATRGQVVHFGPRSGNHAARSKCYARPPRPRLSPAARSRLLSYLWGLSASAVRRCDLPVCKSIRAPLTSLRDGPSHEPENSRITGSGRRLRPPTTGRWLAWGRSRRSAVAPQRE